MLQTGGAHAGGNGSLMNRLGGGWGPPARRRTLPRRGMHRGGLGKRKPPCRARQSGRRYQTGDAPFPAQQAPERERAQAAGEPVRAAFFGQQNLESEPHGQV